MEKDKELEANKGLCDKVLNKAINPKDNTDKKMIKTNNIKIINVNGIDIRITKQGDNEYLCVSDFTQNLEGSAESHINNWFRTKNTVDFLGVWEELNNQDFNSVEFDRIRMQTGTNTFRLTAKKWKEQTQAIGIYSKAGRHGSGVFAHIDIALEFASWLSPQFKLYLIKEFQRLKKEESTRYNEEWDVARILCKINYRIHTDAIKNNLIPTLNIPKNKECFVYSKEADMYNKIMFGMTAKEFANKNPELIKQGKNIRDTATTDELTILQNLETTNAYLLREGMPEKERIKKLIIQATEEKKSLERIKPKNKLPERDNLLFKLPKAKK